MEDLFRIVSDSLARHGVVTTLDHRRLRWSQWIPLSADSTATLLPSVPGLFALAEELQTVGGRRMLALFRMSETDDIEAAIDRLLCDETSEQKLTASRCFVRFAAIEDAMQRHSALAAESVAVIVPAGQPSRPSRPQAGRSASWLRMETRVFSGRSDRGSIFRHT